MILAYSVARGVLTRPIPGISVLQQDGLYCFYSAYQAPAEPAHVQQEAVRFFEINRDIFAQMDLIAFRFPTLLKDEAELRRFVNEHVAPLRAELERLQGMAQVSVYFDPVESSPSVTGSDYMRAKLERAHAREEWEHAVLKAAGDGAASHLAQGDRVHLLVPRVQAPALLQTLRQYFQAAGPFPPSSFAKLLS